ncbi:TCDD-inducible poly [ADP-ribose] polymerase-like [Pelobates cultripes]|uniref:Poly [ADP-ribose] polymerase n=1 Tax=Pelobates cultripes TaxID=61616 RepID=A0AAD1RJK5_PELCU|nr:TCDD-inducible poly [ADP-ribose] polymerase-like [Pelobates cultripes]
MRIRKSKLVVVNELEANELDPTAEEIALHKLEVGDTSSTNLTTQGIQEQETCQPLAPSAKLEESIICYEMNCHQYHSHQEEGIHICPEFLCGKCFLGCGCPQHHTVLPFSWQLWDVNAQAWSNVISSAQESLERLYCDPEVVHVTGLHTSLPLYILFTSLHTLYLFTSLPRMTQNIPPLELFTSFPLYLFTSLHTLYLFTSLPLYILFTSLRSPNDALFTSLPLYLFILNLPNMFQENIQTGNLRRMRQRPVFKSPVMITSELWGRALGSWKYLINSNIIPTPSLNNSYPRTWIITDNSLRNNNENISLTCEDREFQHVYRYFHKTMPESQYIILDISRVQNYFQWEKYARKKAFMNQQLLGTEKKNVERYFFHGTDPSFVDVISRQNFDPRVSGRNGTLYGHGCYFARDASFSQKYATADKNMHHFMFLAKVLVGRAALGKSSYRRPPPICPEDPVSSLYDSCVNKTQNPDIFVIFDNDQFYPYFLIKYQKMQAVVLLD